MKQETDSIKVGLQSMKRGGRGVVVAINGDGPAENRLRELGLGVNSEVKVLHVNGTVMCQVNESRFGIDREIAEKVIVRPLN